MSQFHSCQPAVSPGLMSFLTLDSEWTIADLKSFMEYNTPSAVNLVRELDALARRYSEDARACEIARKERS